MKGSAEREAKQLPMTNPAGSRSTDCKVQKTSGIPKDAGGGDPAAPDEEREKAAERETINIRRDT